MPSNIAAAVLPLGLPQTSLGQFIGLLVAHDNAALSQVEGVTLDIIQAGAGALLQTYSLGFRYVWIAAGSITIAAAIGEFPLAYTPCFSLANQWLQVLSSSLSLKMSSTCTSTPRLRRRMICTPSKPSILISMLMSCSQLA